MTDNYCTIHHSDPKSIETILLTTSEGTEPFEVCDKCYGIIHSRYGSTLPSDFLILNSFLKGYWTAKENLQSAEGKLKILLGKDISGKDNISIVRDNLNKFRKSVRHNRLSLGEEKVIRVMSLVFKIEEELL